ncbi:MAG: ATP-binding protein [Saprospiraceae bacterium]
MELKIENLGLRDGLSHRLVLDFCEDKNGFLWISTFGGLNHYNGAGFHDFERDIINTDISATNQYKSLDLDAEGKLWAGTISGDLVVYNIENQLFRHFRNDEHRPKSLHARSISDIYISPQNTIWITGTPKWDISPEMVSIERYAQDSTFEIILPYGRLTHRLVHLVSDKSENLWLVTKQGYYYLDINSKQLSPIKVDMKGVLPIIDVNNRLWYPKLSANRKLSSFQLPSNISLDSWVYFVFDNNHNIWLKNRNGDVYRFDIVNEYLEFYGDFPIYPDHIFNIYEDKNGIIWTPKSEGGLTRIRKTPTLFNSYLNVPMGKDGVRKSQISFYDISEDDAGFIYVTNDDGDLYKIDPNKKTSIKINWAKSKQKKSIKSHKWIKPKINKIIKEKSHNRLWIGTDNHGLINFNPVDQSWESFVYLDSIGSIEPIVEDGQGQIWCRYNEGMVIFDLAASTFRSVKKKTPLFKFASYQEEKAIIWGTQSNILYKINTLNETFTIVKLIANNGHRINPSHGLTWYNGYLWMGSAQGLLRYDPNTGITKKFTTIDGLCHDKVYTIIPDDECLWLGTYNGLSKFDITTETFTNYARSDGITHPQFNEYSAHKASNGTIYMGGKNGINSFQKDQFETDQPNARLHWTGFKKYDGEKEMMIDLQIPENNSAETLRLNYNDQSVTFTFALLNLAQPIKNQYAFYLENFDIKWHLPQSQNFIHYNVISPGNYTLYAKAFDHRGNASVNVLTIPIQVLEVWYNRWWARCIYVLIFGTVFWMFYQFRVTQKLKQQEAILLNAEKKLLEEKNQQIAVEKMNAEKQKERAERSEKFKEQFLANMSHEIRTPMYAISGMTKILKRNDHLQQQNIYLNAIHQSSDNLLVILNDILDMSKIEAGKMDFEMISMSPDNVIKNIVDILKFKAAEKSLKLSYRIADDIPQTISGDPTRLSQILINLADNAIKFTETGNIHISLVKSQNKEVEKLLFTVEDSGKGIPGTDLIDIFNSFEQADLTTTRKYGGTGLGLSISKQLVELQGGKIWAESNVGRGSTFSFDLPLITADGLKQTQLSEKELKDMGNSLGSIRILLVDDNAFNTMVASDDLSYYIPKATIIIVDNGPSAISKYQNEKYDAILMDVQMPGMNGHEVTRAIRKIEAASIATGKSIPIIAMTASLLKSQISSCYDSGMNNYIPKPYKAEELIGRIYEELI